MLEALHKQGKEKRKAASLAGLFQETRGPRGTQRQAGTRNNAKNCKVLAEVAFCTAVENGAATESSFRFNFLRR